MDSKCVLTRAGSDLHLLNRRAFESLRRSNIEHISLAVGLPDVYVREHMVPVSVGHLKLDRTPLDISETPSCRNAAELSLKGGVIVDARANGTIKAKTILLGFSRS